MLYAHRHFNILMKRKERDGWLNCGMCISISYHIHISISTYWREKQEIVRQMIKLSYAYEHFNILMNKKEDNQIVMCASAFLYMDEEKGERRMIQLSYAYQHFYILIKRKERDGWYNCHMRINVPTHIFSLFWGFLWEGSEESNQIASLKLWIKKKTKKKNNLMYPDIRLPQSYACGLG